MTPLDMRAARLGLGLSLVRLGAVAGVSERTVAAAERGKTIGPEKLAAIEKALIYLAAVNVVGAAPLSRHVSP